MAKPYKQGDLDGLCGVYSVINAICSILPKSIDADQRETIIKGLFKTCIEKLERRTKLANTIIDGLSSAMLKEMLNDCKDFLDKPHALILDHEQLTIDNSRIDQIIKDINEDKLHPNTAHIIGVSSEDMRHWSVIKEIRNGVIYFHDSAYLKDIPIKDLAAYNFSPGCTHRPYKEYWVRPSEVWSIWINRKKEDGQ